MSSGSAVPRGVGEVIVTSRGFDEYTAMFGLADVPLEGLAILDAPGGASGFPAIARAGGARVVSTDPAYALPRDELIATARHGTLHGNRYVRDNWNLYTDAWFPDADAHAASRLAALEVFAADYRGPDDRYVAASLPDLPFPDRSFDLVLSGHLLFTYPDHLDETAHLACLRELVRVSRRQVRIFPLLDTLLLPSPYLDRLRDVLAREGTASALVRVPYEFQRGAHTMLVLDVPADDATRR
jgi:hypothetical protein